MTGEEKPIEQVPDKEIFRAALSWSRVEMEEEREWPLDFEWLIDQRLAQLKDEIMQVYRDYRRAPAFFPKDDNK